MKTLFEGMDTYSRHAYLYSAWTAMLIPCILASAMIFYYEPTSELQDFWKAATASIPVVVFLALGYFLRERVRATSKLLFQFPLFKEDETHMPTTDFLMWSSDYSDEMKRAIRNKVKKDFNYTIKLQVFFFVATSFVNEEFRAGRGCSGGHLLIGLLNRLPYA